MSGGQRFKVKLANGRILGPLDLDRVRLLILKNQIVGTESAREYPKGEWVDINLIGPIADMLIAKAQGRLKPEEATAPVQQSGYTPLMGDAGMLSTVILPGAQARVEEPIVLAELEEPATAATSAEPPPTVELESVDRPAPPTAVISSVVMPQTAMNPKGTENARSAIDPSRIKDEAVAPNPPSKGPGQDDDDDRTRVETLEERQASLMLDRSAMEGAGMENAADVLGVEGTQVGQPGDEDDDRTRIEAFEPENKSSVFEPPKGNLSRIANEKTVIFQRSAPEPGRPLPFGQARMAKKPNKIFQIIKSGVMAIALGYIGYSLFLDDGPQNKGPVKWTPIRPQLPTYVNGVSKPEESERVYTTAMRDYVLDNVVGYRNAANKLLTSAALDVSNVKALAMLASCYLNLIDSSNKDETYFAVIAKLIEMSRAKKIDLPETIIADVEFYVMANRADAAEAKIVEYTKSHQNFGAEMYYYLGLAFYLRGDLQNAARSLGTIPDNRAFSPKVFYLRGQVAEKLGDFDSALKEYAKAVAMSDSHARSRLRISAILNKQVRLKEAAAQLDYLVTHTALLAPKEMAEAYFLHSQLSQVYNKTDLALGDMERACKLDPDNHEYLLELYTLRAKAGDTSVKDVQSEARMYYFMSEGEKILRLNKTHDALIQFMQASEANPKSPLPYVKIGDMFRLQNELGNATVSYRKAAERAPQNIEVWSKYINSLISSYDWDEAKKAMEKFRNIKTNQQSAIDKLTADWYEKQGQHTDAQIYYKKAMSRDTVDPDVYIAYAKSLMSTKNFKEAPFFFALALRFDPLNVDAILGTAKCVAATDSIDRAVSMLKDELGKGNHPSAAILSAIAELNIQKGDWDQAQQYVDQARVADPDYAMPWKLQGQIYMNKENTEKDALDKAAAAYQSFSERNPSDPSGYLERYNIFLKKTNFEKASDELAKVRGEFPKYPRLHFLQGWLYGQQGNHKLAAQEYSEELRNNPGNATTMIALGKECIELGMTAAPTLPAGASPDSIVCGSGAQALFNKAMQIAPTNPEAKHQAGYAAYLLKNYQAAIALFNAALAYDHANPMIYKRMGMAYKEMGDHAGASQAFHKYLEMEPDAPDKNDFQ